MYISFGLKFFFVSPNQNELLLCYDFISKSEKKRKNLISSKMKHLISKIYIFYPSLFTFQYQNGEFEFGWPWNLQPVHQGATSYKQTNSIASFLKNVWFDLKCKMVLKGDSLSIFCYNSLIISVSLTNVSSPHRTRIVIEP